MKKKTRIMEMAGLRHRSDLLEEGLFDDEEEDEGGDDEGGDEGGDEEDADAEEETAFLAPLIRCIKIVQQIQSADMKVRSDERVIMS